MVDLTEFCGDDALRLSITKKRDKAQERLNVLIEKHNTKIKPLNDEIGKYNALLRVMDEHDGAVTETEE